MGAAVVAAVFSEARIDGLRSPAWGTRTAAFAASLAIVALAVAPGPGEPTLEQSLVWWVGAGAAIVALTLAATPLARRIPPWAVAAVAAGGVAVAMIAT
jgi:hypothetical protein